jgi:hypothetical protein
MVFYYLQILELPDIEDVVKAKSQPQYLCCFVTKFILYASFFCFFQLKKYFESLQYLIGNNRLE